MDDFSSFAIGGLEKMIPSIDAKTCLSLLSLSPPLSLSSPSLSARFICCMIIFLNLRSSSSSFFFYSHIREYSSAEISFYLRLARSLLTSGSMLTTFPSLPQKGEGGGEEGRNEKGFQVLEETPGLYPLKRLNDFSPSLDPKSQCYHIRFALPFLLPTTAPPRPPPPSSSSPFSRLGKDLVPYFIGSLLYFSATSRANYSFLP